MTRIAFMGTPEFAVPSLETLAAAGYEIVGVWTRADQPAGRGKTMVAPQVKQVALRLGLSVYQPVSLRSAMAQRELAEASPDLIVVAAYGLILPQAVLDLPRFGCINVHGSLLPRHRGAAPIAAAILAGDPETGVSIMQMEAGLDTGAVLASRTILIADHDTTETLTHKLSAVGGGLLAEVLPNWIAGEIVPQPQDDRGATYSPKIDKAAGNLDWSAAAIELARRVRAYQPWPSAYSFWRGSQFKIIACRAGASDLTSTTPPGTIVTGDSGAIGVATGNGLLWLERVQLSGKREMTVAEFARGAAGFVGSRLTVVPG